MNIAVGLVQDFLVDPLLPTEYKSAKFLPTELFSIWLMLASGSYLFYFTFASLSYYFFYLRNRATYYPPSLPDDLSDQVKVEIGIAMRMLPRMAILFMPFTWGVLHGYSKIYYDVSDYGWVYLVLTVPFFLFVTDFLIYWIHRLLHWGLIYKHIHKPHHTYKYTTPFSSHAFHYVDGWAQGVPYYIFIYLFPTHYLLFVAMFIGVNMWTINIHDQVDFLGDWWIMNSTGHHTVHHTDFNFNYGQYFSIWDRLGGTYKQGYKTNELLSGDRITPPASAKAAKKLK